MNEKAHLLPQPPRKQSLAINHAETLARKPSGPPMLFRGLLKHNDFWMPRYEAAAQQAPLGQWELSQGLLVEITYVLKNLSEEWGSMGWNERTKFLRRGYSIVALSQLCTTMFSQMEAISDGQGYGFANTIPEIAVENRTTPLDYRLHAPRDTIDEFFEPLPADAAPEGSWYKAGDLLVRRTLQVDSAPAMEQALENIGVEAVLNNAQTLFPYHERNTVLGPVPTI